MTNQTIFAALADPTRRSILERLRGGPQTVGALAAELPISRPAVSQHLRVLKEAQLVCDEAVGTRRYYRVDARGFDALRDYVDGLWSDVLAAFQAAAERAEREGRR